MWCGVSCCVVVWCAVWCVVCGVCPSTTSPCVPAPRAHVETHARDLPANTETFKNDTRSAWVRGRGCRQPRVFHRKNISPIFCLPRLVHVESSLAREVNQSYHRIFPIFKFENGSRTTCSRFLQSFASTL